MGYRITSLVVVVRELSIGGCWRCYTSALSWLVWFFVLRVTVCYHVLHISWWLNFHLLSIYIVCVSALCTYGNWNVEMLKFIICIWTLLKVIWHLIHNSLYPYMYRTTPIYPGLSIVGILSLVFLVISFWMPDWVWFPKQGISLDKVFRCNIWMEGNFQRSWWSIGEWEATTIWDSPKFYHTERKNTVI